MSMDYPEIGGASPISHYGWRPFHYISSENTDTNITELQKLVATDDTESDKLRMHDALITQQKQLQESLEDLERLQHELEVQRAKVDTLESEKKQLKHKNFEHEYKINMLTDEKKELQKKVEDASKINDMIVAQKNTQIERYVTREVLTLQADQANDKKIKELEQKHNSYRVTMENKVKALEKEKYSYQEQMTELKHTKSHPQFSLPSPADLPIVAELQKEVEHWKNLARNAHESQKELTRVQFMLTQCEEQVRQHQRSPLTQKVQANEQLISSLRSQVKELQEQERKFHHAQSKVQELSEKAKNVELLEEEKRALQEKAQRSDEHFQRASVLQNELNTIRAEKAKWDSFQGGIAGFQSPQHLAQSLADVQRENGVLLSKKGELDAKVHLLEATQAHDKQKLEELRKEIEGMHKRIQDSDEALKRRDVRITILAKEREGTKRILDSYNEDDAVYNHDQQRTQRINELEKAIADRDAYAQYLEDKLGSSAPSGGSISSPPSQHILTKLTQENKDLKTANEQLNKELEETGKYTATLEERLGKGEFDSSKSKVLHFTNNPEKMKHMAEMDAIKSELSTMRTQLEKQQKVEKQLQFQLQQQQTNPSQQPQQVLPGEITALQQKLYEAEKMNTRLKSVFRTKIDVLKERIEQLLGFRFEILQNDQYSLTSSFADHPATDAFLFRQEGQKMVLVTDTEYAKQWAKDIEVYLHKCKSIPAFLSTVTLEYFNRQTYAG